MVVDAFGSYGEERTVGTAEGQDGIVRRRAIGGDVQAGVRREVTDAQCTVRVVRTVRATVPEIVNDRVRRYVPFVSNRSESQTLEPTLIHTKDAQVEIGIRIVIGCATTVCHVYVTQLRQGDSEHDRRPQRQHHTPVSLTGKGAQKKQTDSAFANTHSHTVRVSSRTAS